MFEQLNRYFSKRVYQDVADRQTARILLSLIIIYWFASLIVLILDQVWGNKFLTPFLISGALLQLIPIILLRAGKLSASGFTNTIIYLALATYFASIGQGIHDYVVILYPIIIMIAGLTSHRRGLFMATLLTIAAITWLIFGEINGWIYPVIVPSRWPDIIAASILILTGSFAVYQLISNLEYGLTKTWQELAERKRVETALRESEENLKEIIERSPDNIFVVDVKSGDRYSIKKINAALEKVFDTDRINIEGKSINELVGEKSAGYIQGKFAECIRAKVPIKYEEFAELPGRTYSTNLIPIMDDEGNVIRLIGISRDITERKQIELVLKQSEERFRALIEHSTDAITLIDANARVIYESPSVQALSGYTLEERRGKSGLDLIYPEDLPVISKTMQRVMAQPKHIESAIFRSFRKDGVVRWTEGTAINLLNEPSVGAIVINYRDITDRKNAEDALRDANDQLHARVMEIENLQVELREQALHDPLTGLYNRRHLADAMGRELARVKRDKKSMSVIVMDIDHFKKINDNFGHQIGDQFLIGIAKLIAGHARSSDIACRYGGEEFLLVMPGATLKTAMKRAEKICAQVDDMRIPVGKKNLKVSLSLGVATYPKHGKGAEEIVIKADKAMYRAKRAGRNCVRAWE